MIIIITGLVRKSMKNRLLDQMFQHSTIYEAVANKIRSGILPLSLLLIYLGAVLRQLFPERQAMKNILSPEMTALRSYAVLFPALVMVSAC